MKKAHLNAFFTTTLNKALLEDIMSLGITVKVQFG